MAGLGEFAAGAVTRRHVSERDARGQRHDSPGGAAVRWRVLAGATGLLLLVTGCGATGTTAATAASRSPCPSASGSASASPSATPRGCATVTSTPAVTTAGSRWSGTLHLTETYGSYTCPEPSTLNFKVASDGAVSGVQVGEDECTKTHFAINVSVTGDLSDGVFHLKLFAPQGHLEFPLSTPTTVKVRLTGVFSQGTTWIALINLACTNC